MLQLKILIICVTLLEFLTDTLLSLKWFLFDRDFRFILTINDVILALKNNYKKQRFKQYLTVTSIAAEW